MSQRGFYGRNIGARSTQKIDDLAVQRGHGPSIGLDPEVMAWRIPDAIGSGMTRKPLPFGVAAPPLAPEPSYDAGRPLPGGEQLDSG